MTLFLKALIGTGFVVTASTVAVVSSKSLWNSFSSAEIVESTTKNSNSSQQDLGEVVSKPSPSHLQFSHSREVEPVNVRVQSAESSTISTPSTSRISSRVLSEAEKYKERLNHPELCKVILSSKIDNSKVQVCRASKDSLDLEFEYHTGVIGEMPIPVKDLRYTYNQLIVNLVKEDSLGLSHKRLDLSDEIIVGKGLIPSKDVNGQTFTDKQCKLELIDNSEINSGEWKIGCKVVSK